MAVPPDIFAHLKRQETLSVGDRVLKSGGVLECQNGTELFNEFMERIGDNPVFILQEIAAKIIKDVNKEDARFDFSSKQADFVSYGDKWILLPEEKTVKVAFARIEHVRYQADQVLQEHIRKMKAFVSHYDGLLLPIIRTMETGNLLTAGEAIQALAKA